MRQWEHNRGNAFDPSFEAALAALGIDQAEFDTIAPDLDAAICGSSDERLDREYPPRINGRRLILTEAAQGLPPLRISFYVDDTGKVVYEDVDRR